MIKNIGGTEIKDKHRLSCHCGAVVLELDLPDGIVDPRRCDCSICRRKGAIVASVPLAGITIIQGEDVLTKYEFNTHTAKHFFCSRCGIYTHHQRRSNPQQYGFNVGCLEGVNPFALADVPTNDGVNHPADRQREMVLKGAEQFVLRQAAAADIPAMSSIRLSVRENILSDPARVTEQMYHDYLGVLGRGWVVESHGKILGFSYAASGDSSIWALFVSPEYEGHGLGARLLASAVDWLFEQGNETVRLSTAANTRADKFYCAQGWTRHAVQGDKDVHYQLRRAATK